MDPISITASVLGITSRCLYTAKTLYSLREKFKNSQMTISAIYSECTVISASLGHIQSLVLTNPEILRSNLQSRPELEIVLDTALTGCMLVFSILDDEVQTLNRGVRSLGTRVAHLWKEGTMADLLTQVRGQQTALSLLIQALQMESILDVRTLLQNNNIVLQQLSKRTLDLRRTYPKIRTIPSILEASFSDVASFNSLTSSSFTATPFAFEEDLLSSPAYQRARRTLATSKGSATTGDRSDRETLMPERPSVMQQRSQDHEQLMKEKLDIAYKEIMMAAEREKLYYEELKKSLEEIEETKKSLEAREEALKKFAQRDEELVLDLMHMNKELENSKATIKTLEADLARLDKIRSKELEEARSEYIMKIRKMETCISDISKGPTKVEVESPNPSDLIKALEAHLKHRQDLHSHALEAASSEYRKNIRKLETCIADISEDATRLQSDSPIFYTITRPGTGNKNGNRIKDKRWRIKKGPYSEMSSLVSPKETGKDQSENTEPVLTYRHRFVWKHTDANEVYVTGTFDNWAKTIKLEGKGDFFEKIVDLPKDSCQQNEIFYKFVVDGNWTTNSHLPIATDEHNNSNNVAYFGPTSDQL